MNPDESLRRSVLYHNTCINSIPQLVSLLLSKIFVEQARLSGTLSLCAQEAIIGVSCKLGKSLLRLVGLKQVIKCHHVIQQPKFLEICMWRRCHAKLTGAENQGAPQSETRTAYFNYEIFLEAQCEFSQGCRVPRPDPPQVTLSKDLFASQMPNSLAETHIVGGQELLEPLLEVGSYCWSLSGDSSVKRQGMDLVESKARLSRVTPPNVPPLEQEWAPEDARPWCGAWRGAP
eukprot:scaffold244_cov372-Pavlova_lutheri.AAC.6